MQAWYSILNRNPLDALLSSEDEGVIFFTERDLLGKADANPKVLWGLPEAQKIIRRQQLNGSWKYPAGNKNIRSQENYDQIETYRNLGFLVEMSSFDKSSPAIAKAADFLFSFQAREGDIRGILGSQYTPYYTGGMLELLIKAGYGKDPRVEKAFQWLYSIRQDDGGWAIPFRTLKKKLIVIAAEPGTLQPDRSKPFSHMVTGMVLRAYAAHEKYRHAPEAKAAGQLLLSSLFKKDNYPDRAGEDFWLSFSFPFWFTDLISALDSLSLLGFSKNEPHIAKALDWLAARQEENGLWKLKTLRNQRALSQLWLSLAICRIIKRFN